MTCWSQRNGIAVRTAVGAEFSADGYLRAGVGLDEGRADVDLAAGRARLEGESVYAIEYPRMGRRRLGRIRP